MIKAFHDGEFDDEDLLEELEYYASLEAVNQEVYDNFLAQVEQEEMELASSNNAIYNAKLNS